MARRCGKTLLFAHSWLDYGCTSGGFEMWGWAMKKGHGAMRQRTAAVMVGAVLVGAVGLQAAPFPDRRSSDQKASDALLANRYEAAVKFFQTFIESSVGD